VSDDDLLSEADKVKRVAAAYAQWHEQPPPPTLGPEGRALFRARKEAYAAGITAGIKQAGGNPEPALPATEAGYWAWRKNYCVAAGAPFPAWHTAWHAAWSAWEAGVAAGRALATDAKIEGEGAEGIEEAGDPPTGFARWWDEIGQSMMRPVMALAAVSAIARAAWAEARTLRRRGLPTLAEDNEAWGVEQAREQSKGFFLWWDLTVQSLEPGSWTAELVARMAWEESEARTLRRCDRAAEAEVAGDFVQVHRHPAAALAAALADSDAAVEVAEACAGQAGSGAESLRSLKAAWQANVSLAAAINAWQAEVMSARVAIPADARDPAEWQCVHENTTASGQLDRMRVAGGWLYRSTQWINGDDDEGPSSQSESMAFVAEAGQE